MRSRRQIYYNPESGRAAPATATPMINHLPLLLALLPAPAAAQRAPGGDTELLRYIRSDKADPSCGACLKSAGEYFSRKRAAELSSKTVGMVRVPQGEYKIGSEPGKGEPDEFPRHAVYLDAFYIDAREVTIAEYLEFTRNYGGNYPEWAKPGGKYNLETGKDKYYKRLDTLLKTCFTCPVMGVLWEDADAYCRWKKRRLPTEAEWEAAAAAGSNAKFSFGDSGAEAGRHAWYDANSGEQPHPVGTKAPNALGLYDMHGNVWEWVSDYYDKAYYKSSPRTNPKGPPAPASGRTRVIRGGSWASADDELALANRASYTKANDDIGFRCAISEKEVIGAQ